MRNTHQLSLPTQHNTTVLPPVAMNVYPVAPVATAAAVAAVTHQWEAQREHDEAHATEVLREAVHQAIAAGVSVRVASCNTHNTGVLVVC